MISLRGLVSFLASMVSAIVIAQMAVAATPKSAGLASDRVAMRDARIAFEKRDFKKALSLYETVPQASDYWVEALEERAWSHVQLKEHDQALALVKTLMAPPVKAEIGAEPYLLSTLIQLRLCNYEELFKVLKRFKEDIRPRFESLNELAKSGASTSASAMLARAETQGLTRLAAGPDLPNLPKLFYRDASLIKSFAKKDQRGIQSRLKVLAARDVKETEGILRKLHLVEVEAVQRMTSHLHLADAKKASEPITRDANTLVFPDDENDIWLDELDSYRFSSKGCPAAPAAAKGSKS